MKRLLAIMTVFAMTPALVQLPAAQEAPSTTGAKYVEPSTMVAIKPGEKIDNLFTRNLRQPYVLQRLTDRSYYFQRLFYSTTFYVGDTGVLLFDALEGRGEQLHKAIREVTPLPVTTMVYSHFPHSTEFSGEGPLPFAITLKLCRYSPMLGHQLHRPSDLRMTHAKSGLPDPRKPHHHG